MADGIFGFVPARGGSIGVPGKNLRPLAGRPLVARAIEALRGVPLVASVILSTDSETIAAAGRAAGAEVPFLRPPDLATSEAPVLAAVAHAVAWLERHGRPVAWLVMVQPTSPFVRSETVRACLAHAIEHDLPAVQSVSSVKEHPAWMRVPDGLVMRPFARAKGSLRRQDLPELLILNGAINVYRGDVARAGALPLFPGFFRIDRLEGLDIDDEFDLALAELIAGANEERFRAAARQPHGGSP